MSELDRRSFLRLALSIPTGVIVGPALRPILSISNDAVNSLGVDAGNAHARYQVEKECHEAGMELHECVEEPILSREKLRQAQFIAPLIEEFSQRAIPSWILSDYEGQQNAVRTVFFGTHDFKFTRREAIVGLISSTMFAAIHNLTPEGFNFRILPVAPFMAGEMFWYLQRRLGFFSNLAAHFIHNHLLLRDVKIRE